VAERRQGRIWAKVMGRLRHQHVFELVKPVPGLLRAGIVVEELRGKPWGNQHTKRTSSKRRSGGRRGRAA
jgi:hypothetical protein